MRIALVTREYPPETAWGGIASFYKSLADSLNREGFDVEVFAQGKYGEKTLKVDGILVHYVCPRSDVDGENHTDDIASCSSLGAFATALALGMYEAVAVRHNEKPFDVVEGHEHLGINAIINLNGLHGAKTVTRYHSSYKSLVERDLVDWPPFGGIYSLEEISIRKADYRISTSEFIDRVTKIDFGVSSADFLVHNFVDDIEEDVEQLDSKKENLILFVGRMVLRHKRPDLAIHAFCEIADCFPEWRIEFAGADMPLLEGGTVWAEHCEPLLEQIDSTRFKYHGVLGKPDLNALYAKAKIILVPSSFESFGLVALEAVMSGCVPLVSKNTALADLIHDQDLIHENGSVQSLTEKLTALIEHQESFAGKIRDIREWIKEYDPKLLGKENAHAFNQIIGGVSIESDEGNDASQKLLKISIVTPSYNQGEYIEETIQSIQGQDYKNFEHIVIDGASTDNTVEVLNRYPHLKWVSEKDEGQTHAINKGILRSDGDIIAYLNSDDRYVDGAFRKVVDYFSENPDAMVLVGACDYIDGSGNVTGRLTPIFKGFESLIKYWGWEKWHCIPQQSVFIRREVFSNVGVFEAKYHYVMDLEMWFRIAKKYTFRVVDEVLSEFRLVEGTKTISNTDKMYEEEFVAFCAHVGHLEKNDARHAKEEAVEHLASKYLDLAEHKWLRMNDVASVKNHLKKVTEFSRKKAKSVRYFYIKVGVLFLKIGWLREKIKKSHFRYLSSL